MGLMCVCVWVECMVLFRIFIWVYYPYVARGRYIRCHPKTERKKISSTIFTCAQDLFFQQKFLFILKSLRSFFSIISRWAPIVFQLNFAREFFVIEINSWIRENERKMQTNEWMNECDKCDVLQWNNWTDGDIFKAVDRISERRWLFWWTEQYPLFEWLNMQAVHWYLHSSHCKNALQSLCQWRWYYFSSSVFFFFFVFTIVWLMSARRSGFHR